MKVGNLIVLRELTVVVVRWVAYYGDCLYHKKLNMNPTATTFLLSFIVAITSAILAYHTAMVFAYGAGDVPNAIAFIATTAILAFSIWMMLRLAQVVIMERKV